jgi:hypothetical protein
MDILLPWKLLLNLVKMHSLAARLGNSNPKTVLLNLHYTINLKEGDYKPCYRMIILDFGI